MVISPCAKINLGLNVTSSRADGYHGIESVFYPVPLCDTLEITLAGNKSPADSSCELSVSGAALDCDARKNLVVKAYDMIGENRKLPPVHVHLHKNIPSQAGLGGGSSDGAFMIRLMNEYLKLNLTSDDVSRYATSLGADCSFFIHAKPSFVTGIGDIVTPIRDFSLSGYYIVIIKPNFAVSTAVAYKQIIPSAPEECCIDIVRQPVETWRGKLTNDFEQPIFKMRPELLGIKEKLYSLGATYAQMSGSGSAIYGIFSTEQKDIPNIFKGMFTFMSKFY